jgi:molybdenum cofactor cytidylyltransferase
MEIVTRAATADAAEPELEKPSASLPSSSRRCVRTRMGGPNKLLAEIGGRRSLHHRRRTGTGLAPRPVIVVTGISAIGRKPRSKVSDVQRVPQPEFRREGLSTSVKAGLAAVPTTSMAAIVLLGGMPQVRAR